ncbi:MAG: DUF3006 family protein [Ilumatobacteraceae bacterium]
MGVIDSIDGDVAVVLVGHDQEAWHFPLAVIPREATEGTVLLLRRRARTLEVMAIDPEGEVMKRRPFDERLRRARRKERFSRVIAQLQLT